jgi:hypothetical protein
MKVHDRRPGLQILACLTVGLALPDLAAAQGCNNKVVTDASPDYHLIPDEETARAWNYELVPGKCVFARYVKYQLKPRRAVCVTEVQALEFLSHEPFDIRIALPDD